MSHLSPVKHLGRQGAWVAVHSIQGSSGFAPESDRLQPVQAVGPWARTPVFMTVPSPSSSASPSQGSGRAGRDNALTWKVLRRFSAFFPEGGAFPRIDAVPECPSHPLECSDLLRRQDGWTSAAVVSVGPDAAHTPGHCLLHMMSWKMEQLSVSWESPLISPSSLSSTGQTG